MNFYISDLHLGNKKALKEDNRPFESCEEQDLIMIRNWNKVVTEHDTVYILGDFTDKDSDGLLFLNNTKGRKILITGNQDKSVNILMTFAKVYDYLEIEDSGVHVILSHYPIAHWKNADCGSIHLYGHIHQGKDAETFEHYVKYMRSRVNEETTQNNIEYKAINVGCMMPYMNYTPRTLAEIIRGDIDHYKSK